MMSIRKFFNIILILMFLYPGNIIYALDGVEIFSGFFAGDLHEKRNYEGIALLFALNFDLRAAASKIKLKTKGRINFILEPFINTIVSPDANIEIGSNFLLKYVFPLSKTFQPYFKAGLGAVYMSQHTREQSTQYNFLPQVGAGFHFFVKDNTALSFEYRRRHLSNASFDHPNKGIDAYMFLGGISFFFK